MVFINNLRFYLKSTINISDWVWDTFILSEDFEQNQIIDSDWKEVSLVFRNARQIERFSVTIANWIATIVKRGIVQKGWATDNNLKKQWIEWTEGYVTAFDTDLLDMNSADQEITSNIDFTWDVNFDWGVTFNKSIRVPEFNNETERDSIIISPENWMLCYLTDVEDYYSFKNGIWVKWLGWSGWSVTWYQDSTDDWTITGDIDWVNLIYELSNVPAQPRAVILTYNGQMLELWASDDYTISSKTITMNFAPESWKLVAYYPDIPVWTDSAETRVTSNTDAKNWELYRSTNDNNNLYYKDEDWDTVKIFTNSTNLLNGQAIDYNWTNLTAQIDSATEISEWIVKKATDAEALAWTDTTRYISSKQMYDNNSLYTYKATASNNIKNQDLTEYTVSVPWDETRTVKTITNYNVGWEFRLTWEAKRESWNLMRFWYSLNWWAFIEILSDAVLTDTYTVFSFDINLSPWDVLSYQFDATINYPGSELWYIKDNNFRYDLTNIWYIWPIFS